MAHPLPEELEHRMQLLDEWVKTRREITRLEAKATSLLTARMRLFEDEARVHGTHRDTIHRSMVAEYAAAGHLSKGTVEYAMADAQVLGDCYPAVQSAFAEGAISVQHVREIIRAGSIIREAVRNGRLHEESHRLFEAAVLVVAEQDTPAHTRTHARQVAATLAEVPLRERHASAAEERTVTLRPIEDGLALLTVVLPEALGVAILDRLTRMTTQVVRARSETKPESDAAEHASAATPDAAQADLRDDLLTEEAVDTATAESNSTATEESNTAATERSSRTMAEGSIDTVPSTIPEWMLDEAAESIATGGSSATSATPDAVGARDTRTFDQIRADLLVDMLLASDPSQVHGTGLDAIQAHVQVTVAATTLAGLDERLAELDGHGPIHPDVARDLAGRRGGWTRLFLDPTGMIVQTDAYSPTESMKRFLRARDQHCRFPGCRVPATRCDIDHNHDHARGGVTCNDNLTHFCRSHHTLKHPDLRDEDRWTAHLEPDGSVTWRSPLGRDYRDLPRRRVMFA